MDDKEKIDAGTIEDDLDTTAPNSAKPDGWQMPEPVFRQTSGRLPGGFEKNYGVAVEDSAEALPVDDPTSTDAVSAYTSNPDVEATQKGSVVKLVLVLLGLGAMIAFIVVFLTILYFFFLRS